MVLNMAINTRAEELLYLSQNSDHLDELCANEEGKAEDLITLLEDILASLIGTPPLLEKSADEEAKLDDRT